MFSILPFYDRLQVESKGAAVLFVQKGLRCDSGEDSMVYLFIKRFLQGRKGFVFISGITFSSKLLSLTSVHGWKFHGPSEKTRMDNSILCDRAHIG